MAESIEQTATQYSKYFNIEIEKKLVPINNSIDGMLARLEEFETIINFSKQDRTSATDTLILLQEHQDEIEDLFRRIDALEALVEHAKSDVLNVETEVEKAEERMGCGDNKSNKVTNIFTPLFKRSTPERKPASNIHSKPFNSSDYFH